MKNRILLASFFLCSLISFAQNTDNSSIKILTQKKGVSLRGLSVPSQSIIWASGNKGSIAKSINAGVAFEWWQVTGYENRDFRSIHAWDDQEAIIVAVASPALILKTKDGGKTWYKVYENPDSLMFLDAIHFKDAYHGLVVGDPVGNSIFLLSTEDRGEHWNEISSNYFSTPLVPGEAFFASSNSNITQLSKLTPPQSFLVSGGLKSRLWINGEAMDIPMVQGGKSKGANSIALSPQEDKLMIVGGDFTVDTSRWMNAVGLQFNQHHWMIDNSIGLPHGYRSSVTYVTNDLIICSGTSGVDISENGGKQWKLISNESFHVVRKQPNTKSVFLAGAGGRIGYYSLP